MIDTKEEKGRQRTGTNGTDGESQWCVYASSTTKCTAVYIQLPQRRHVHMATTHNNAKQRTLFLQRMQEASPPIARRTVVATFQTCCLGCSLATGATTPCGGVLVRCRCWWWWCCCFWPTASHRPVAQVRASSRRSQRSRRGQRERTCGSASPTTFIQFTAVAAAGAGKDGQQRSKRVHTVQSKLTPRW